MERRAVRRTRPPRGVTQFHAIGGMTLSLARGGLVAVTAGRSGGTGLGRVVCAAPDVAAALGYDIAAALEDPDDH
jgi:hypothetical protein